jgi:phage baseplate assembly protein V
MEMMGQLNKAMQPMRDRIKMMVARGVIKAISDSGGIQTLQAGLLADELKDGLERFQQYGFTSHPHAGAEAAIMFMGGNRDHGVVIAVDDKRYRLKGLQGGEVALYTDEGDKVVLKRGNNIEITTKTLTIKAETKVRMETPTLEVTGNIIDNCDSNSVTVKQARDTYNLHTHSDVQPGPGNTGDPNQQLT